MFIHKMYFFDSEFLEMGQQIVINFARNLGQFGENSFK
jgi:hypothetical protein